MWWLAIVGPVWAAFLWVYVSREDKRRGKEVEAFRKAVGERGTLPRKVASPPGLLSRAVVSAGGGDALGHYELVPKIAFLSIVGSSFTGSSDFQTVVAKLDRKAPSFTVRPLAIVDGAYQMNTGLEFKKHPGFTEYFVVEPIEGGVLADAQRVDSMAASGKAIRKWLSGPIRDALLDLEDVWLRVEGLTMTLTLYGASRADSLMRLVETADVLFAEHGADGGPSLLGEDEDEDDDGDGGSDEKAGSRPSDKRA